MSESTEIHFSSAFIGKQDTLARVTSSFVSKLVNKRKSPALIYIFKCCEYAKLRYPFSAKWAAFLAVEARCRDVFLPQSLQKAAKGLLDFCMGDLSNGASCHAVVE